MGPSAVFIIEDTERKGLSTEHRENKAKHFEKVLSLLKSFVYLCGRKHFMHFAEGAFKTMKKFPMHRVIGVTIDWIAFRFPLQDGSLTYSGNAS